MPSSRMVTSLTVILTGREAREDSRTRRPFVGDLQVITRSTVVALLGARGPEIHLRVHT